MNRKLFVTILVVLFLFLTASNILSDTDILGWGKVTWGMTHSQVAELYDLEGWSNDPKYPTRCQAKKRINIQGHDFRILFWFDKRTPGGKLYQVVLATSKDYASDKIYNSIAGLLNGKYGKPDSVNVDDTGSKLVPVSHTSLWLKKSGQLKFQTTTVPPISGTSGMSLCFITYISVGSEADKL